MVHLRLPLSLQLQLLLLLVLQLLLLLQLVLLLLYLIVMTCGLLWGCAIRGQCVMRVEVCSGWGVKWRNLERRFSPVR